MRKKIVAAHTHGRRVLLPHRTLTLQLVQFRLRPSYL